MESVKSNVKELLKETKYVPPASVEVYRPSEVEQEAMRLFYSDKRFKIKE